MPDHGLTLHRCQACASVHTLTLHECPVCQHGVLEDTQASAHGTLFTYTVIRRPGGAFAGRAPYAVALIDLASGERIVAHLESFEPEPSLGAHVNLQSMSPDGIAIFSVEHP